jgi:hypothetical protein
MVCTYLYQAYAQPETPKVFILQRIFLMFDHVCIYLLPCTLHRILVSNAKNTGQTMYRLYLYILVYRGITWYILRHTSTVTQNPLL